MSTITDGQGLNMTVQSYNGNLDFGFIACRELVPDLWSLVDYLHESMQELLDSIGSSTPARRSPRRSATAKAAAKKAAKRPAKKATAAKAAAKRTKKAAPARTRAPVKRAASR